MKLFVTMLGSSLLAACAVDDAPEIDTIPFTIEDSYGLNVYNGTSDLDMGPIDGRSCFLSGVGGFLKSDVSIRIREVSGDYHLQISTSFNVRATARCVNGTHTTEVSQSTNGSTTIAAMQPGRRCFLTGLTGTHVGSNWITYFVAGDGFDITNDGTSWSLKGHMASYEGEGTGYARCFDGVTDEGGVGLTVGNGSAAITEPMTSEAGAACGLQTIQGIMAGSKDDGVFITRDQTTKQYSLSVSPERTGVAGCMK
jgi:hypothetical protein